MTVSHEPWLVALSLIVALQGSFVGLSIAIRVRDAVDPHRRYLLAGAAACLALAIWSMHFVGMLAARLPVAVDFLVLPTLLSFLICVLVVGVAVFAASNGRLGALRLGLSAFVMGAGICTMHYLGMYALHASSRMEHDPVYVIASFLVAFNASGLAMWLSFGTGRRPPLFQSSAVLAMAISAMHYTAMAGMRLYPLAEPVAGSAPSVTPGTLAIIVALVAFVVSGLFLLTLVPPAKPAQDAANTQAPTADEGPETGIENVAPEDPVDSAITVTAQAGPGAPVRAPLGLQAAPNAKGRRPADTTWLPVERDGTKAQLGVSEVFAVHADAHYTRIFDGSRVLFCPLSITEVEQLLEGKQFNRVHRSHIVNLDRVAGHKRVGDSGILIMEGGGLHEVPVSRSRWRTVKKRLDAGNEPTGGPAGKAAFAAE